MITENGLQLDSSDVVEVSFNSQFTIYEHSALCTLPKGELNFSTNQTMDDPELFDALMEGELTPYITKIGLYNDQGELLAISKVPRAIRRDVNVDQTFLIRFDV
jgi:hypothetical protein